MSLAVIGWPHSVPPDAATSWIRLFCQSAMYRSPAWLPAPKWMLAGSFSPAEGAGPPSPLAPHEPVTPATVYRSPAVIAMPHWVPVVAAISTTRQLFVSAMYRPEELTATPPGWFSRVCAAGVPFASPVKFGRYPAGLPATVYTSPAVIEIPHWVPVDPAISWTRLSCVS